jgi:hypothetical protein
MRSALRYYLTCRIHEIGETIGSVILPNEVGFSSVTDFQPRTVRKLELFVD